MPSKKRIRKQRILIVDDHQLACNVFEMMLDKTYLVKSANTMERAIEQAQMTRFDLIIQDIHLGRTTTGLDVLHEIRALPKYDHVPVLAVSAYGEHGARERLIELGFDDYLDKPCNRAQLLRTIEWLLEAGHDRKARQHARPADTTFLLKADWIRWPSE